MKISTALSDEERHYLSNLLRSGAGEVPDEDGNISSMATHKFIVEKSFIVGAVRVVNDDNKHGLRNQG